MKFYTGVTDTDWYSFLRKILPDEVNFWQPGGRTSFKVLTQGAPFLFKLKSPDNAIGGLGFFVSHTFLPLSVAWDIFGFKNGAENYSQLLKKILSLRTDYSSVKTDPVIGCIVLTNPVFFDDQDWIPVPSDWASSIVQGKSYSTEDPIGKDLWSKVNYTLAKYQFFKKEEESKSQFVLDNSYSPEYRQVLTYVRTGQGSFRVSITEAYTRRCAVTGEKTLPVLEAAHIKPFADSGPYFINNGILLRSDLHKLFDSGYMTLTKDYRIEISRRIKEEFENGGEYYKYHGNSMIVLPHRPLDQPRSDFIEWHNQHIYKG